jgi:hypothetical protein
LVAVHNYFLGFMQNNAFWHQTASRIAGWLCRLSQAEPKRACQACVALSRPPPYKKVQTAFLFFCLCGCSGFVSATRGFVGWVAFGFGLFFCVLGRVFFYMLYGTA